MTVILSEALLVSPHDFTGVRCPDCGEFVHDRDISTLTSIFNLGGTVRCKVTGREFSALTEYEIHVRQSHLPFLDEEVVKQSSWFHATVAENWLPTLRADRQLQDESVLVHLGTYSSAMWRMQDTRQDSQRWYVHEVQLAPQTVVAKGVQPDQSDQFPYRAQDCLGTPFLSTGVTRYLNAYESPGSISLLAHPDTFDIIGTQILWS